MTSPSPHAFYVSVPTATAVACKMWDWIRSVLTSAGVDDFQRWTVQNVEDVRFLAAVSPDPALRLTAHCLHSRYHCWKAGMPSQAWSDTELQQLRNAVSPAFSGTLFQTNLDFPLDKASLPSDTDEEEIELEDEESDE